MLAAQYNIPAAEADELTAGLWNNPSILVDTIFEPLGSNWNQTNAGGPRQFDLILSYPFDLSGKHSTAVKSAHAAVSIAQASFQDAMRRKILDIRLAYFDVLVGQQQLALTKEKEASLNRLVQLTERRIGTRKLLPLLALRAQLARDQASLDTQQREINLRAARMNLAVQLAYNSATTIVPDSNLRDFTLGDLPGREELTQKALSQRPDLKALELAVDKSEADIEVAHAQTWGDFLVTAGVSTQGPISANPVDPNSNSIGQAFSWQAGVTIPIPVFNRNQGNVQKATLLESQSRKQMESLRLAITQEVDSLSDQLRAGKHLIEMYEKNQLAQAREVHNAQQRLFGTGSNALLDYFDAINAYVAVYSSYYDAIGDYRRNSARLNASLGKDLP